MSYYNTFMEISETPSESHKNLMQELVNYQFDNASTYYQDVEEETGFGTLIFKNIKEGTRINTIVDAKTGQRVNDDYRKIIFKNIRYEPMLGTRYKFDDNIWIAFSTDNIKNDTSSAYLRRCNNTINTQDKYGNIHKEPCYIDYRVTETQPFREKNIDIPNGRMWCQCQYNEWTKNIDVNDRFIFGGTAYSVRECHKFDNQHTLNNHSATIISFYADNCELAPDDNIELQIANYRQCEYSIESVDNIECNVGDTGKIKYTIMLNGEIQNDGVNIISDNNDVVSIQNDIYTANSIGECNISIELLNNILCKKNIKCKVSDTPVLNDVDLLLPDIKNIKINKTQLYSIYEYKNNQIQDTKFTINCYDVPNTNYYFETDGNKFSITNLKTTENIPLRIVCKNNNTGKETEIKIKLGGLF